MREKLIELFTVIVEEKINKVIIEYKDRLALLSFNYLHHFFQSHEVEIECVEKDVSLSYNEELVESILSISSLKS